MTDASDLSTSPAAPPAAPARVEPGSAEWRALPDQQRQDQLRGPANPRASGHGRAQNMPASASADRPGADAPPAAAAPAGEKHKIGAYEITESDLAAMMGRQALDDLRKATLPASPLDYKLELPENLALPGGAQFQFDEASNKATFDAARAWAHGRGMSQSDFSEMMGLYASHVAQTDATLAARSQEEIAKAGPNAPQRMDAVGRWITSEVGEADAKPIRATIVTDAHLRFYEKLMTKIISQGVHGFSQQHRVENDGKPSEETWNNWSFAQQREWQESQRQRQR